MFWFNRTRRWAMSARCGLRKTGEPTNTGKPAHDIGHGIWNPAAEVMIGFRGD